MDNWQDEKAFMYIDDLEGKVFLKISFFESFLNFFFISMIN